MENDYWPESPLYSVSANGCIHHPYRRQRGVLPAVQTVIYLSRHEASLLASTGDGDIARTLDRYEAAARLPKPYLESPI